MKRENGELIQAPISTWDNMKPAAHLQIGPKAKWEAYHVIVSN